MLVKSYGDVSSVTLEVTVKSIDLAVVPGSNRTDQEIGVGALYPLPPASV